MPLHRVNFAGNGIKKVTMNHLVPCLSFVVGFWTGGISQNSTWMTEQHDHFRIFFQANDRPDIPDYLVMISQGIQQTSAFFHEPFSQPFDVYIHPNRLSLDSTWQSDWGMPEFQSECWMVASGVAAKLDLMAPRTWDSLACEHRYDDSLSTQQLITHELVHVFHGQHHPSPDFSTINGIDWLIEGMAVFVSGQCDPSRMVAVKEALRENNLPGHLADFWSGKLRYGLSGSMVMYLDHRYGRDQLYRMLAITDLTSLLSELGTTEPKLLEEWRKYMEQM